MLVPIVLLLFILAALVLYRYLKTRGTTSAMWRSVLVIGTLLGVSRATLACAGWYWVEHHSGPSQIPAYALALLAWPEGMVLDTPRLAPAPLSFYPALASLLIATTILAVSAIALVVQLIRGRRDA